MEEKKSLDSEMAELLYSDEIDDKTIRHKLKMSIKDLLFEVSYAWRHYIHYPWRTFINGLGNLRKYRKLIWNDRWWDYSFTLEILLFKLKDMESNWGVNTHYVNDTDEKETLQKLIDDLEWMVNEDIDDMNEDYLVEYKKRSSRFFGRLDRNHRKLWD